MTENSNQLMKYLLTLFTLMFSLASYAGEYPTQQSVLKRLHDMVKSVKSTNYKGRFVYSQGQQLELLEIIHKVDANSQEKVSLKALTGDATEIIHDGNAIVCVYPDANSSSIARNAIPKGISPLLPETLSMLSKLYTLSYQGDDRLVDRAVDIFSILPKDKYRYGMRFFIDQITALPLQIDKFGEDGSIVTRIMFTEISFDVGNSFGPVINQTNGRFIVVERDSQSKQQVESDSQWLLTDLPAGYKEINRRIMRQGDAQTEHIVLGDGLSSMSVYIEPSTENNQLTGFASIGAVQAYGKRYGNMQVTAMGEVPHSAVAYVANGVKKRQ